VAAAALDELRPGSRGKGKGLRASGRGSRAGRAPWPRDGDLLGCGVGALARSGLRAGARGAASDGGLDAADGRPRRSVPTALSPPWPRLREPARRAEALRPTADALWRRGACENERIKARR
jgi:hypothetical protein